MRRLLILTFKCCLSIALLMAGAKGVGVLHGPPDHVAILHLGDCAAPCWLGIIPGISQLSEVRTRIKAAYPESGYQVSFSTWDLDGTSESIEAYITDRRSSETLRAALDGRVNDPVIRDINLSIADTTAAPDTLPILIGDVLRDFDSPMYFVQQPWYVGGPGLSSGDENQGVTYFLFPPNEQPPYIMDLFIPVRSIKFYGTGHYIVPRGILSPGERKLIGWHGFTWY